MLNILHILTNLSMFTFIVASMLVTGLGLTLKEVIDPLRKVRSILLALLANFVLVPIMAILLTTYYSNDSGTHIGTMLLAFSAGAPFLPILAVLSHGNIALSAGLTVILMLISLVYAPLVLPLVIKGVSINPLSIAQPLFWYMLLPLFLGLIIRHQSANFAKTILPWVKRLSQVSVLVLLIAFPGMLGLKNLLSVVGSGIYREAFIFIVLAMLIGYLCGGKDKKDKVVMMLGAGQRNISAALIIAATSFSDHKIALTVIIYSLVGSIILFSTAAIIGKNTK